MSRNPESTPRDDVRPAMSGFALSVLNGLSTHIAVVNGDGIILAVNRAWRDFAAFNGPVSGNVCEGANYLQVCDAAVGDDSGTARDFAQGLRAVLSSQLDFFELDYPCHSPGEQRWFTGRVTRLPDVTPTCVIVGHDNVTARKKAEIELVEAETKHRLQLDHLGMAVGYYDPDGRLLFFNHAAARSMGGVPSDFVGKSVVDLYGSDLGNLILGRIQAALHQETSPVYEDRVLLPTGDKWFLSSYARVPSAVGGTLGVQVISADITDRKQREQAKLDQQTAMAHLSRVVTAGALTSGLAHQLNQPLAAILLYAETSRDLLKAGAQSPHALIEPINSLITQAERARSIITHFRKFLRRHPLTRSTVDVNRLVKDTMHLLASELGRAKVEVRYELTTEAPTIVVDSVMLEQVIVNLVMNALDAMSSAPGRPRRLTLGTATSAEGTCTVTIRDSGPGVADSTRELLFDALVSGKPHGLGLGLSVSRSIIEQHGGRIWYEPADDGGAVFRFTVPKNAGTVSNEQETGHGL